MRKTMIMVIIIMVLAICLPVFAQEFPDVPTDHWAYNAVQELAATGIIQGYPDGTYGGKRAMTRYEFAEALAKAIPGIAAKLNKGGGASGKDGATGPAGAKGDKGEPGMTPAELAQLMKMANEFRDELAALGVDVDQLKRDIADLQSRVSALEIEQKRVVFHGEANLIGRGEVLNTRPTEDFGLPTGYDIDGRPLPRYREHASNNLLSGAQFYTDFAFGVKARVGKNANLNAVITAGNYMSQFAGLAVDDFTLWNLNMDATMKMGPLGAAKLTVGRFPFQLTPLTLKFVDPDSYTSIGRTDDGNFVIDGAKAMFGSDKFGITVFAAKAASANGSSDSEFTTLMAPNLMTLGATNASVAQLAGARATIGAPLKGQLGLTYYQTGQQNVLGKAHIYGADYNGSIGKIDISAEYAKSQPNDGLTDAVPGNGSAISDDNTALNAKLGLNFGKLKIGGGYTKIEPNFFAPGDWSRAGMAVNLVNVQGLTANLNLVLSQKISLTGSAMFLQPVSDFADTRARVAVFQNGGPMVSGGDLDKITTWKAGLKYGLSSANTIDLGYEEVRWAANSGVIGLATGDDKERYYTIGLGHAFNPNSGLKLMYQIIDFRLGALDPYGLDNFRGGVATAQVNLKY